MNKTLLTLVKPESLLSWVRVMVANQVSTTGYEWVSYLKQYNSGTYNNQWIVTDYKKFVPGSRTLQADTLWIAGDHFPSISSAPLFSLPFFFSRRANTRIH